MDHKGFLYNKIISLRVRTLVKTLEDIILENNFRDFHQIVR